ncbi:hypothetical protein CCACVL1_05348 [Corchorus capsularis]|uniref:Uncharacterized protein n=1 Tax=Corchorus capsularis TaxID=210143 RepID=A0A1R3JL72_COCAP|nr:hypothetical protein CCACVL1_05348 [Corchorus capsularis]
MNAAVYRIKFSLVRVAWVGTLLGEKWANLG